LRANRPDVAEDASAGNGADTSLAQISIPKNHSSTGASPVANEDTLNYEPVGIDDGVARPDGGTKTASVAATTDGDGANNLGAPTATNGASLANDLRVAETANVAKNLTSGTVGNGNGNGNGGNTGPDSSLGDSVPNTTANWNPVPPTTGAPPAAPTFTGEDLAASSTTAFPVKNGDSVVAKGNSGVEDAEAVEAAGASANSGITLDSTAITVDGASSVAAAGGGAKNSGNAGTNAITVTANSNSVPKNAPLPMVLHLLLPLLPLLLM